MGSFRTQWGSCGYELEVFMTECPNSSQTNVSMELGTAEKFPPPDEESLLVDSCYERQNQILKDAVPGKLTTLQ